MHPDKIRCLLVDDERPALDELIYLLSQFPNVEVVGTAQSCTSAIDEIQRLEPDVVFQDIQLPGATGFHVLEKAQHLPNPPLFIFATSYDQYAIRAFEENAVDYLLKPIARERLAKSLERLRSQLHKEPEPFPPNIEALLRSMGLGTSFSRLSVESEGRIHLLDHTDVIFIRAEERRMMVYTAQSSFVFHGQLSLDRLETKLATQSFFRANRSELVNLAQIHSFTSWMNGKYILTMRDQAATEIVVSKGRVRLFKELLEIG